MKNKKDILSIYYKETSFFLRFIILAKTIKGLCIQRMLAATNLSGKIPNTRVVNLAEFAILVIPFILMFLLAIATEKMTFSEMFGMSFSMSWVFIVLSGRNFIYQMPMVIFSALLAWLIVTQTLSLISLAAIGLGPLTAIIFLLALLRISALDPSKT